MKNDKQRKANALRNENKTDPKIRISKTDHVKNGERRDAERILKLMLASHRPG